MPGVKIDRQTDRPSVRFLIALLAPIVVAAVVQLTWPFFQLSPIPLFLLAVTASAWYGGLNPGLFSVFVSLLLADYFFVVPYRAVWPLGRGDLTYLVLLSIVGSCISLMSELMRRETGRTESALNLSRASEERYRKLAENFPNGAVITYDKDLRVTFIAGKDLAESGSTPEFFIGKRLTEIAPPEVVAIAEPHFRAAFAGQIETYECPYPDGRTYLASVAPLMGRGGEIDEILVIVQHITKQKQIESERSKLAAIVESSDDAIIGKTLDGIITSWNRGAEHLYGYAAEEVIGRPISILLPPHRADDLSTILERIKQGQALNHYETERLRKDGRLISVSLTVSPIHDAQGLLVGASAIARDITDRKRIADSLIQSEQQLAEAQRIAHVGSWSLDLKTNERTWSRELYSLFGLAPDLPAPALDEVLVSAVHPDDREFVKSSIEQAIRDQEPCSLSFRIIRPDGAERIIHSQGNVITDSNGTPIRMFGTAHDVTEHRLYEEKLREYEKVVEGLDEMITVIDRDYRYLIANRAFLTYREMTKDQVIGQLVYKGLDALVFEQRVRPRLEECFQGKVVRYELKFRHPKLGERDLLISYFPIEGPAGIDRAACILRDVTETRRAEEAMRDAEQKYRDIFENAGEGIFRTTPEGRYLVANPALARMHGIDSPEELIRTRNDISHQVYVDPAQRDEFKHLLETQGAVRGFEHQIVRSDGSRTWVSVNARTVRDEQGKTLYYEGTAQDINPRKLAEARSTAFATLARKLSGTVTKLETGKIIAETAHELFGWDACNLDLYDAERDLVHSLLNVDTIEGRCVDTTAYCVDGKPTSRARRVIEQGPQLLLREDPVQFDADSIPFGDALRPSASIMSAPVRLANKVVGMLSIQSYSARAYDAAALNDLETLADYCGEAFNRIRAEESFYESEERFRQLAEHFEDVISLTNKETGKLVYVNPAYERVFRRTCESIYAKQESFMEVVHTDDRAAVELSVTRMRDEHYEPAEYRIVWPDESIRWVLRRSFPIRNTEGTIYLIAGIAQDITARKEAETQLRESEQEQRRLASQLEWERARLIEAQEVAKVGSWETWLTNLNVVWSEETYRIFEADPATFHPTHPGFLEFVHPEDREKVDRAFSDSAAACTPEAIEHRIVMPDGRIKMVEGRWRTFQDAEGRPVRAVGTCQDITERKQAQEALRESEERYRDLVENSQEFICTHDLDGVVLSANRAAIEVLGHDPQAFEGPVNFRDLLVSEVRDQFDDYLERIRRDGFASGLAMVQTRSGERRLLEYHNSLRTEGVAAPVVRGMANDITERKRAEESLKLFRNLIDQSTDAIEVIDPVTFRFLDCNQSAHQSLGYTREEFLSLSVFDVDSLVDPVTMEQLNDLMKDHGFTTLESLHRRKDGTTFPVEVIVKLVTLEKVYRLAVVRDITSRKLVEKALRESEERYRELFENAKDAIYVHDLGGRYTSLNQAAEKLIGFSREEIIGKHFSNFIAPRDLKHVRKNLCKKLDAEGETTYEVDLITRGRRRVPVEVMSRLIYENGQRIGVQGTARDITERKRSQEALQIYSRRLIEAQEAERQSLARELHDEIGQVLTAVKINLQTVQSSCRNDPSLPNIEESIVIVDEALGRIRDISLELRPSLLDDLGLASALRWYVDRYGQRTGIVAEVLCGFAEGGLPRDLETECFRIAQEALTNVARHAHASRVRVQLEERLDQLLLTIADDGTGFDSEELLRTSSSALTLGLRGMRERVLAMNGHIEIDSSPGNGTKIRASFPLRRSNPAR